MRESSSSQPPRKVTKKKGPRSFSLKGYQNQAYLCILNVNIVCDDSVISKDKKWKKCFILYFIKKKYLYFEITIVSPLFHPSVSQPCFESCYSGVDKNQIKIKTEVSMRKKH